MKTRLITLMLMIVLVFSYTIPALASIDYSLNMVDVSANYDSNVSSAVKYYYKCNYQTYSCYATTKFEGAKITWDSYSACKNVCNPSPAYTGTDVSNTNYYVATTTTKPSYTYTTYPSYISYTTTKPSYTYTNTNTNANVAQTRFRCNYSTYSCTTTVSTGSDTFANAYDCAWSCIPKTTTNPISNFVVTTKPSYTYTTLPNLSYVNTTTTKPVVVFNNQALNQMSNYVVTTKPSYTYTTLPSYISYTTSTTIPSYTYTTYPVLRTINPITTTTLGIVKNTQIDYTFRPAVTTKPSYEVTDQNVVKKIDLTKAVPITTKPSWLANIVNQDLTFKKLSLLVSLQVSIDALKNDLMKLQNKEGEKLQMIVVGEETKKIATGPLILVVLEDSEYEAGLLNYIARKESEGYQVKLEKLSNIGKKPEQMKNYFRKLKASDSNFKFAVIPVDYLSGMLFHYNVRNEISDYYYCKLSDDKNMMGWKEILTPDIYVSRANRSMLEREFTKLTESKMLITFPIMRYMHKIYDQGCWYADLKKADPSRLGNTLKSLASNLGINVKTFYETRGVDPSVNKPDFQLSNENISREATNANFILSSNTAEFTYIDFKNKKTLVENFTDILTTAVYKFDNGDKFADRDEIELEPITDFSNLNNIDRIGGLFFESNKNTNIINSFSSYASYINNGLVAATARYYGEKPENWYEETGPGLYYNDDGSGLVPSYVSDIRFFAEEILAGKTTSEALWNMGSKSINTFGFEYDTNSISMKWHGAIYGDPAKALKDTIEQPRAEITPGEIVDEAKIEIPIGKTEIEFLIKNIGKVEITYSFEKNDILEITPITGNIPVEAEEKIKIKISNNLPITYQKDDIQSTPKRKSAKIYFKSNAGDKEITVIYWGV